MGTGGARGHRKPLQPLTSLPGHPAQPGPAVGGGGTADFSDRSHYLGKETVQNLLVFRFGNSIFEPIWNHHYIDHVQVTAAEELGVEGRGGYYDTAGSLRDVVPNHIAQLVSLVGMEPPISFHADAVRDEQVKLLRSVQPLSPEDVLHAAVRGPVRRGTGEGAQRCLATVRKRRFRPRATPTRSSACVSTSTAGGGPTSLLRPDRQAHAEAADGNRLCQFKAAPFMLFTRTPVSHLTTNRLFVRIQPDEGISLRFGAKVPGPVMRHGAGEYGV